jgi:hypothetical protein
MTMVWRTTFRKRKSFLGGLFTLNLNKKSISLTTRVGPVSHTRSTNGRHTTSVNGPGPVGLRNVTTPASRAGRHRRRTEAQQQEDERVQATRDDLQARIDSRRENIRRINEERRERTRRWREERGQ